MALAFEVGLASIDRLNKDRTPRSPARVRARRLTFVLNAHRHVASRLLYKREQFSDPGQQSSFTAFEKDRKKLVS